MAQGLLKKSKATPAKRTSTSAQGPKRIGPRNVAPKKQSLIKQKKLTKKLTAGLTARTERSLAARAGHLEMLAGGKKDKKENQGKK
ncbi:hypothetical protein ATEIFO6365_0011025600 [Aspergillus terreus]|uniref:Uncharacterized protein n=1 Tax=Aspergillus terreus TaxID=33178 RepID=A0A5M3YYN9_ASPTE|nr:hypothetical protein ATETN484_0006025600 [Aspergillus terreus]GFF19996.1 hypothetical protein ATEIFO6365_0011025600 [Aspergillus terreus]